MRTISNLLDVPLKDECEKNATENTCFNEVSSSTVINVVRSKFQQSRQRKQMNRARSDRTLGSMDETTHKRLKTVDKTEQEPGAEVNSVIQTTYRVFLFSN